MSGEPTREELLAVAAFSEQFDAEDFQAGTWAPSETSEDGVLTLGYWVASDAVRDWHQTLYGCDIVVQFDWMTEEWHKTMRGFESDPSTLDSADLETVRKVLTTISRADRFSEGYMAECFENGLAQAATRRLATLAGSD